MSLSEEDIINILKESNLPGDIVGIGDDCAVIQKNKNISWLISNDALAEDVHFSLNTITAYELGIKSVKVNASDIAAMGATPKFIFVACAIPQNIDNSFIKNLIDGIKQQCKNYNIYLLGGDTTASKSKLFISITIMGESESKKIKYRSSAKIGDYICITGNPGLSAAGLDLVSNKIMRKKKEENDLIQFHISPYIYINESNFLANFSEVNAMIDCSDGLNRDLTRICEQSNCSANINLEKIPVDKNLLKVCQKNNSDLNRYLLSGGEDYYLIFTINSNFYEKISKEYLSKFNKKFYKIGEIVKKKGKLISYFQNEIKYKNPYEDFDHFRNFVV
ncbi:thiamine-phosphate kinase [Rickettsiales endosymbiont of Trichoplax sp. H2]|uniref:thiamine-phosphate kinase n=1 Tax=Rickettsiales endosymbiont of Trichoplax sp. H2 TaxID=2021221 RepID=UPI0012B39C62|nr:thiamine-phosphate kinase [Rickettsiales endosymbiont of Trichoplax sp. H2]MSO14225.1 Thiamine-monophosphate kinase [Rickettsiales endosymbiont of Trichoplax sp. H2]